jgi:hypothetical protein
MVAKPEIVMQFRGISRKIEQSDMFLLQSNDSIYAEGG